MRRKNFFITTLFIIFFWITLGLMIFFIDPEMIKDFLIPNAYLLFFINLFFALFFTLAVIFANSRKGLIFTLAILLFLILKINSLDNFLNIFLIIAASLSLVYYFTKTG